jgi:hypothetical protein
MKRFEALGFGNDTFPPVENHTSNHPVLSIGNKNKPLSISDLIEDMIEQSIYTNQIGLL